MFGRGSTRYGPLKVVSAEGISAELNMSASEHLAPLNDNEKEWRPVSGVVDRSRNIFFAAWITFVYLKKSCCRRAWRQMEPTAISQFFSLGCASGEKPYTMAMISKERVQELAGWALRVKGIEISPAELDRKCACIHSGVLAYIPRHSSRLSRRET